LNIVWCAAGENRCFRFVHDRVADMAIYSTSLERRSDEEGLRSIAEMLQHVLNSIFKDIDSCDEEIWLDPTPPIGFWTR
jgi:hypothetical protein